MKLKRTRGRSYYKLERGVDPNSFDDPGQINQTDEMESDEKRLISSSKSKKAGGFLSGVRQMTNAIKGIKNDAK